MSARYALTPPTDPIAAASAPDWARRGGYRSADELAIRAAVEVWGRAKWPDARLVHELVMGRGATRADMAFVRPDRLVTIEIKSEHDDVARIFGQIGSFRLASHELWLVTPDLHGMSADLLHYLLPSIGIAAARRAETGSGRTITERARPAASFHPHRFAQLALLWVAELTVEADRHRIRYGRRPSHSDLVERLSVLDPGEIDAAVCRQLRGRAAFWRADPPIRDGEPAAPPLSPML